MRKYNKTSNIRCTKFQYLYFSSRLAVVFAQSIDARCSVEIEDLAGAKAQTSDAPTASEWATILLPSNLCFILEVYRIGRNVFQLEVMVSVMELW